MANYDLGNGFGGGVGPGAPDGGGDGRLDIPEHLLGRPKARANNNAGAEDSGSLQMGLAAVEVVTGRTPGARFALDKVCMLLGRNDPPNIHVDIDLEPQEMGDIPMVSRRHAELSWAECRLMLRDLGSNNGTWVNDQRLPSPGRGQPGEPAELHAGDAVRIANIELRVVAG